MEKSVEENKTPTSSAVTTEAVITKTDENVPDSVASPAEKAELSDASQNEETRVEVTAAVEKLPETVSKVVAETGTKQIEEPQVKEELKEETLEYDPTEPKDIPSEQPVQESASTASPVTDSNSKQEQLTTGETVETGSTPVSEVVEEKEPVEAETEPEGDIKAETPEQQSPQGEKTQEPETKNKDEETLGETTVSETRGENGEASPDRNGEGDDDDAAEDEDLEENLDFDEDKRNPQYIPKKGAFYEHDDRRGTDDEEELEPEETKKETEAEIIDGGPLKESPEHRRIAKILQSESKDRWEHDLFDEGEQGPKSQGELVSQYGYDIRDESSAPRAARRRKYGRGPNKYTRDWKDERAYQGRTHNAQQERRKEFHPLKDDFPCLPEQQDSPSQQSSDQSTPASQPQQSTRQQSSHGKESQRDFHERETNHNSKGDRQNEPIRKQKYNQPPNTGRTGDFRKARNDGDFSRDDRRSMQSRDNGWDNGGRRDPRDQPRDRDFRRRDPPNREGAPRNENWRSSRDVRDQREVVMRQDNNKKIGSGRTQQDMGRARRNDNENNDRRNYDDKRQQNQPANNESKRYTSQRAANRADYPPDSRGNNNGSTTRPSGSSNVPPHSNAPQTQQAPVVVAQQAAPPHAVPHLQQQQAPQRPFYDMQRAAPYYVQPYDGNAAGGPNPNFIQPNPYMNQPPPFLPPQAAAQYILGAPEGPSEVYQGPANGSSGITYFHPHPQQVYIPQPNPPQQRPKAIIPIVPPPESQNENAKPVQHPVEA